MKLDIDRIDNCLTVIDKLNALATRGLISHPEKDAVIEAVRTEIIEELKPKPEPVAAPVEPATAEPIAPAEPEGEAVHPAGVLLPKVEPKAKGKGKKK